MSAPAAAAGAAMLALTLSACLSIKNQTTSQRAPGVISLRVALCASDYDQSFYLTCDDDNVKEVDNRREDADRSAAVGRLGQLLLAFRVPARSEGPESFLSDLRDVSFSRDESYATQLTNRHPPPAGMHWVSYISSAKRFEPNAGMPATLQGAVTPEFTLPPAPGGGPFEGPYLWRAVAGFRELHNERHAAQPVRCAEPTVVCVDTPPLRDVTTSLQASVSDFGVLPGTTATAGHGETATVSLPVRYVDGRGIGAQELAIRATTTVPATAATPAVTSVLMSPDNTTTVDVAVPVPPGTPLGAYTVTLTAASGSGVTRSNTATINVVDKIAPTIQIGTPAQSATFVRGQRVPADYACSDELNGTGVTSCSGPVASGAAIDTGSTGAKTFTVTASDGAGNAATATRHYAVVALPPARVNMALTFNNRTATRRSTRLTRLVIESVTRGSTVTVRCRAPKDKRCPVRRAFIKRNARGTFAVKRFVGKSYRPGTVIEARATKPGMIGAVRQLTIFRAKDPILNAKLCLPPDAKRSAKPIKCPQ